MQRAANTRGFLIDFISSRGIADSDSVVSHDGLLHYVLSRVAQAANSRQLFNELAQILIRLAEHAYSLRDMSKVEEASRVLMNLPLAESQQIGLFYQALTFKRKEKTGEAESLLEAIADNGPSAYRARAIQALGALHHDKGQPAEALRFHLEAVRAASDEIGRDLLTILMVQLEISHVHSDMGDHRGALAILENLSPFVRIVAEQNPLYFYFYHNELAVEFAELGRIAEAEAACAIALASPFAPAYPEWSETREEIAAKRESASPSVVAINRVAEAAPSPKIVPERKPELVSALAFNWLACEKAFVQRASIAITAVAVIAHDGITQLILYWLRKCARIRGPPTLLQKGFNSFSERLFRTTERKTGPELTQFAAQFFCAQSYCLTVAISIGLSLCWRNNIPYSLRLRCYGESDAGLLIHPAASSNIHSFEAHNHQHFQTGLVHSLEVNEHKQHRRIQMIKAGYRATDSLPTLTAHVRVNRTAVVPTHVRVQEDAYDYSKEYDRQSKE